MAESDTEDKPLQEAAALLEQGKLNETVALTNEIISRHPMTVTAYILRGWAYRYLEKYDEAIESYTDALRVLKYIEKQRPLRPEENNGSIQFLRGVAWLYRGEPAIALADFQEMTSLDDRDSKPYMWMGYCLVRMNQVRKATDAYSRAIAMDPQDIQALINRGLAFLSLNEYDHALSDFNEVIRLDPRNAKAYFRRGVTQSRQENNDAAVESYNQAIRLDPKYADAYYNRALAFDALGQANKARQDRQRAIELDPKIVARAARGQESALQSSAAEPSPVPSSTEQLLR